MKYIPTYFARQKNAVRHVKKNGRRFSFDDLDELSFWIGRYRKRYDVVVCTTRYEPLCKYTDTGFAVYPGFCKARDRDLFDPF